MRYLFLSLCLLLISCSSALPSIKTYKLDIQQGNVVTPKMMLQLKPGMSKSQVRFVLGTPLLTDSFHRNRWDYFYEMHRGGEILERRRLILEFENENLKTVRGDIIPAGQAGAEGAPIASVREIRTATSNKALLEDESNKSWWERFKFWDDDTSFKPQQEQSVDARQKRELAVNAQAGNASPENQATTGAKAKSDRVSPAAEPSAPSAAAKQAETKAAPKAAPAQSEPVQPVPAASNDGEPVSNSAAYQQAAAIGSEAESVVNQVKRWNEAWQGRHLNDYLNLYSANYVPQGMSRRAWLEAQQQRFGSASEQQEIQIRQIQAQVHGSIASAEFEQITLTAQGSQTSMRRLDFESEGGLWRIVKESLVSEFAPQANKTAPDAANANGVILHERSELPPEYPQSAAPAQGLAKPAEPKPAETKTTETKTTEPKPAANPSAPARAAQDKSSAEKSVSNQAERQSQPSKKALPLPAEGEPGYFEKLLEKIGF